VGAGGGGWRGREARAARAVRVLAAAGRFAGRQEVPD